MTSDPTSEREFLQLARARALTLRAESHRRLDVLDVWAMLVADGWPSDTAARACEDWRFSDSEPESETPHGL